MYIRRETRLTLCVCVSACVWTRQGECGVYTWIYTITKTSSQLESTIVFFSSLSLRSAQTSNAPSLLLIMLHADDIATAVTDTRYYSTYSTAMSHCGLISLLWPNVWLPKIKFLFPATLFYTANLKWNKSTVFFFFFFFHFRFSLGPIIINVGKKCGHKEI